MALSASTVFETRTTGLDTNGGGFVTGASGTDYSQQNTPQYSVTDGVTAGTTTITSATANFGTDVVGNIIYVQGGTGSVTAGWYQITARNSATSITVDRSTGLTAGIGVTLHIGGAFLTIATGLALMTVSGMTHYVKSGTYSISVGLAAPAGASYNTKTRVIGYNTARDDLFLGSGTLARPIVKATAAIVGFTNTQSAFTFENFEMDGNSTGTQGVSIGGSYTNQCINLKIHDWTAEGYVETGGLVNALIGSEIYNCAGSAAASVINGIYNCVIHDCAKPGILSASPGVTIEDNVIYNLTGAGSDAIKLTSYAYTVRGNSVRNVAGSGIDATTYDIAGDVSNNILVSCGQNTGNSGSCYGITTPTSPSRQEPNFHHNAFFNNKTAAITGILAGTGDITLTGDPYTSSTDLTLNNTAGAGAACRSAGYAGTLSQGSVGYKDVGALRHQDPASSGGESSSVFG